MRGRSKKACKDRLFAVLSKGNTVHSPCEGEEGGRKKRMEKKVKTFSTAKIYIVAFFVMTPCRLVCSYQHLGGFHLT
jgi:hypothetical protein